MSSRFFAMTLCVFAGCNNSDKAPIAVGHIFNAGSADGIESQRGIELALEELGTTPINQGRALAVRQADTRGDLASVEAQAVRQAAIHRTPILLGGTSPQELLAIDKARVPFLAPVSYRPVGLDDLAFVTGLSAKLRAQALAQYLVEERALKEVRILLDERQPDAEEFLEAFKARWTTLREKHTLSETVRDVRWTKDMKVDDIVKLATTDEAPANWIYLGTADDFALLRKRGVPLLAYAGQETAPSTLESDKETRAVVLVSVFAVDPQFSKTGEFAEKYQKKFKSSASGVAALNYDNVRLVAAALKSSLPAYPERIREELRKLQNFEGLAGPMTVTTDQTLQRPAFVGVLADGKLTSVKRYAP